MWRTYRGWSQHRTFLASFFGFLERSTNSLVSMINPGLCFFIRQSLFATYVLAYIKGGDRCMIHERATSKTDQMSKLEKRPNSAKRKLRGRGKGESVYNVNQSRPKCQTPEMEQKTAEIKWKSQKKSQLRQRRKPRIPQSRTKKSEGG